MAKKVLLEELKETERQFHEKIISLLLGGFGVVAALAWNDAIQSLFNLLLPSESGLVGKFLYAVIVTVIVVFVSVELGKLAHKD